MFRNITWETYLIGLGTAVVLYYIFVGLKYYGFDIKELFSGRGKEAELFDNFQPPQDKVQQPDLEAEYEQVEELSGRIRIAVAECYNDPVEKNIFLERISTLFAAFPALGDSPFRPGLNELVLSECGRYGAVIVSWEDVDGQWSTHA